MPLKYGVVVIGRNEGARLERCLASLQDHAGPLVYVDSNSSDGSVAHARDCGAAVVALDPAQPFTAARARNEGFARLLAHAPDVSAVQFIDGDCEVAPGWLRTAHDHLTANAGLAAVCGRRRERFPQATVYNQLCDLEWDTPLGEALAFGGDVMIRRSAFEEVGGYNAGLIAGEDPELALRLRLAGWKILRLPAEMTLHDAAITRARQWWQRNVRSGHAFAEGCWRHGRTPERHFVRETGRAVLWGIALPLAILASAAVSPWAWLGVLIFPAQWLRLGLRHQRQGSPIPWRQSAFLLLGRLPEAQGVVSFVWRRIGQRQHTLIEYK